MGVPQDYKEAVKWYRLAAEQGSISAQFSLGVMYNTGEGVLQDYNEAAKWSRLAADQGNAYAQVNLGSMYIDGKGVPENYAEAAKWFRKAADQGNAYAQNILGVMYDAGSERLPDAVPLICNPGDVVINNRQMLHGSFANTGFETRVTVNFGFHRRSSVLNIEGAGLHADAAIFDEAFIKHRSRVIGLAIAARKARFPDEQPYVYAPMANDNDQPIWNNEAFASLKDYNVTDLSI